jgi:hypothetical protein
MPLVEARQAGGTECDAAARASVGAGAVGTRCAVGGAVTETGAPAVFSAGTACGLVVGAGAMAWLGALVTGSAGLVTLVGA